MRKYLTNILLSSTLLLQGCSTLYNEFVMKNNENSKALLEEGYNPIHERSCGPGSLSTFYSRQGEYIEPKDVSKEILDNGKGYNLIRNILGIIYVSFSEMTFPNEIIASLKRHGYNVEIKNGSHQEMLQELSLMRQKKEKGIVRIRDTVFLSEHYEAFPPRIISIKRDKEKEVQIQVNIPNYFDWHTSIPEIYKIETPLMKSIELIGSIAKKHFKDLCEEMRFHYMKSVVNLSELLKKIHL